MHVPVDVFHHSAVLLAVNNTMTRRYSSTRGIRQNPATRTVSVTCIRHHRLERGISLPLGRHHGRSCLLCFVRRRQRRFFAASVVAVLLTHVGRGVVPIGTSGSAVGVHVLV